MVQPSADVSWFCFIQIGLELQKHSVELSENLVSGYLNFISWLSNLRFCDFFFFGNLLFRSNG